MCHIWLRVVIHRKRRQIPAFENFKGSIKEKQFWFNVSLFQLVQNLGTIFLFRIQCILNLLIPKRPKKKRNHSRGFILIVLLIKYNDKKYTAIFCVANSPQRCGQWGIPGSVFFPKAHSLVSVRTTGWLLQQWGRGGYADSWDTVRVHCSVKSQIIFVLLGKYRTKISQVVYRN